MTFSIASIKKYIPFVFLVTGQCSCKKFVQVSPPESQLETGMIFSSDPTAINAMIGVYSRAMASSGYLFDGGMSLYPGLSSDELYPTTSISTIEAFFDNTLTPNNPNVSSLYSSAYSSIYDANNMMQNLAASPGVSDSTKKRLTGEAAFIRALTYFCIVNLFGEVPLITSTD